MRLRTLCFLFGCLSCLLVALTTHLSNVSPQPVVAAIDTEEQPGAESATAELRSLFRQVADAESADDLRACDRLQPLPLYRSSPAAKDWSAYCKARVLGDRSPCAAIDAMIVPDLRSLCADGAEELPVSQ